MRFVSLKQPGGPDELVIAEGPGPSPGRGEVLIDVFAAGVNRPDLMQRQGKYPAPPGASKILGLEVAGRIAALGLEDDEGPPRSASGIAWKVGDEVCALLSGGGYAEQCVAPGVQCLRLPAGVTMVEGAAIPETFFTVWTNAFDRGRLKAGEWLLVHGGTSGIGTVAIQLAVARGAVALTTAGSDEKCAAAERLGARRAINYRTSDFVAAVKEITAGRGVDVVLDMVGGDYLARNVSCLAKDGRLVQIAHMGGASATLPLRTVMTERLTITGSTLRPRSPREKGAIAAELEREVWPLIEAGRVRPVVDATYPLADAARAHQRLEDGDVVGKLVLVVRTTGA